MDSSLPAALPSGWRGPFPCLPGLVWAQISREESVAAVGSVGCFQACVALCSHRATHPAREIPFSTKHIPPHVANDTEGLQRAGVQESGNDLRKSRCPGGRAQGRLSPSPQAALRVHGSRLSPLLSVIPGAGDSLAGRMQSWPSSGRSWARSARSWWRSRRLHGRRSSSARPWKPRQPLWRNRSCSCR